jgi:phage terminase large subunit-like protein
MERNNNNKNEKGFVLVFVIAIVAALSVMTTSINYYYDSDLKSVSRNSVMQQVMLAAETGLQEGQNWVTNRLNSNSFALVDIQNDLKTVDSDNKCLNRHGYTNTAEDVYYARRIVGTLGSDDRKFENMSFEVYVQRHADVVKSVYFSEQGDKDGNNKDTTYTDRSLMITRMTCMPLNLVVHGTWYSKF